MIGDIKRFIYTSITLLVFMAIYHTLIVVINLGILNITKDPYIYFVYNISYNVMIINCLLFINSIFNKAKEHIGKFILYSPIIFMAYFIFKCIINILFLFNWFREYLNSNNVSHDLWGFVFISTIIATLITLKLFNNPTNEKKIFKYVVKYSNKFFNYITNSIGICLKICKSFRKNIR